MLSMTLGAMPFFFLGAFGPDIQEALRLSEVGFGTIVAGYFAVAVLFSFPAGALGERLGPRWSMSIAAVGVAASLTGIALSRHGLHLACAVLAGGLANTLTQPGGNMALAEALPPERHGLAFALKQSTIPVAAIVGGFAVPTAGAVFGWRWTIAAASLLGIAVVAAARRAGAASTGRRAAPRPPGSLRRLAPLTAAGVCAAAATTGMVAFFVDSGMRAGLDGGTAAIWFAVGGIGGIAGRMLAGWISDRSQQDISRLLVGFWALGSLGFVGLAVADSWPVRIAATFPTFLCGWGWNGMFHHATVQWSRHAPSWGTGVTQTGLSVGGSIGPIVYGAILGAASFRVAWLSCATLSAAAACLVWAGGRAAASSGARAEAHHAGGRLAR